MPAVQVDHVVLFIAAVIAVCRQVGRSPGSPRATSQCEYERTMRRDRTTRMHRGLSGLRTKTGTDRLPFPQDSPVGSAIAVCLLRTARQRHAVSVPGRRRVSDLHVLTSPSTACDRNRVRVCACLRQDAFCRDSSIPLIPPHAAAVVDG